MESDLRTKYVDGTCSNQFSLIVHAFANANNEESDNGEDNETPNVGGNNDGADEEKDDSDNNDDMV